MKNNNSKDFDTYLKANKKYIWAAINKIGRYINPQDKEDLFSEGQIILWNIFQTQKGQEPVALTRTILYRRLIDYIRQSSSLTRTHRTAISNGEEAVIHRVTEDKIDFYLTSEDDIQAAEVAMDVEYLMKKGKVKGLRLNIVNLILCGFSDTDIAKNLDISRTYVSIQRSKMSRIYKRETLVA